MVFKFRAVSAFLFVFSCCLITFANAEEGTIDLSGVSLKNVKNPVSGIVTGGQPSQADLQLLAERGVKNVINLKGEGEHAEFDENQLASSLNLKYASLPINGADGVTLENALKLDQLLSQAEGDTLLHCASGNRAGALLALRAALVQGMDVEQAIQLGKNAGMTSLESKTRALLEAIPKK